MQAAATEPQLERHLQFVDAQRVGRQCGVPYTYGPNRISTYIYMGLGLKIEKVFGVDQRDTWVKSNLVFRACSNTSFHRVFGAGCVFKCVCCFGNAT